MHIASSKKERKRVSKKKFEEKFIAEQEYSDKDINLQDDPTRNTPEYYEEEGISSVEKKEEEKR